MLFKKLNYVLGGVVALMAIALVSSCRKDLFEELHPDQSQLSISIEEVKQAFGDPSLGLAGSRSSIKAPLDFIPNWNNAILNTQTGAPLVIVDVDTCCLAKDMLQMAI